MRYKFQWTFSWWLFALRWYGATVSQKYQSHDLKSEVGLEIEVHLLSTVFFGLDGEMSGTDYRRHALIQIGLALSEETVFSARISWDDCDYEPEALQAIGLKPDELRCGLPAAEVDSKLVNWLDQHGIAKGSIVPVGWAVSDFDRPFVCKTLPRFYTYLHHHSIELNAVVYTLAGTCRYLNHPVDFAGWKRMAKKMAELMVLNRRGEPPSRHDAGDDALLALLSWNWLRDIIAAPYDQKTMTQKC